jgi:hypothetical protein
MDDGGRNPRPPQPPVVPPVAPQQPAAPFAINAGRYNVADPTGMSHRGYINPATGQPWPTSQPYARNILAALDHQQATHISRNSPSLNSTMWNNVEWRFLTEFIRNHHPGRQDHQLFNSRELRKELRIAP